MGPSHTEMEDKQTQNSSLNQNPSLSPPTPPAVDVVLPGSQPVPENTATPNPEWPAKKKSKLKPIIGGLLAIVLVAGAAFGAFYFTKNLDQASTPNAPSSNPFAREADKPVAKKTTVPVKPGNKAPEYSQVYTTGDKANTNTSNGGNVGTVHNDTKVTGTKNGANTQCGAGYYGCNLGCCKIGATETTSSKNNNNEQATVACTVSSWTPAANTVCTGANVTQTSNCGTTRSVPGTKDCCSVTAATSPSVEKVSTTSARLKWTPGTGGTVSLYVSKNPAPGNNCAGVAGAGTAADCIVNGVTLAASTSSYLVTGLSPATASATTYYWRVFNKVSDTCSANLDPVATFTTDACVSTTWTPATTTVCSDETFEQTSNCGTTREVDGTKECGISDLTMEKKAYQDESDNTAGDYHLDNEIDTVSKDQVFVYAFEITNNGAGPAENIQVVDTLKGDNADLLTFVDSDSRCKYTSSSRKITCTGMGLAADKTDTYKIRVKMSSNAVNGETVKNIGVLTYKDMPTDGEIEASLELSISTVVGCNNTCTSDDECGSGLSCDPDTNKCRKPACSDASSCNCPADPTDAPTRRATQRAAQPTVLPETGILDFPGVAAFGGGLLLAIVGILLAL